jgi:hypothetical protein
MSFIVWVPGGEHAFKNQFEEQRDPETEGYRFVSEWFGEDGYDRGRIFWLQLQHNAEEKQDRAILRSWRKWDILSPDFEHCEDACGFMGWAGFDHQPTEDQQGVVMYRQKPAERFEAVASDSGGKDL